MDPFEPLFLDRDRRRADVLADLRRILPRLEPIGVKGEIFPFGIPDIDSRLPDGGLACGALHEVFPETPGDMPAAYGFVAALLGRMPRPGPVLLVTAPRGLAEQGESHGHGLGQLGLDPARLILVAAADAKQALWAIEESLRSGVPAAVAGAVGKRLDLKASRRLQLAAGSSGVPLLLLQSASATGASVAVTRWRIAAAVAARDRFGLIAGWRWRLALERCRNGRTGEWVVEFDDAYRFRLAAAMADLALPVGRGATPLARAG
jgi:protein ImuA